MLFFARVQVHNCSQHSCQRLFRTSRLSTAALPGANPQWYLYFSCHKTYLSDENGENLPYVQAKQGHIIFATSWPRLTLDIRTCQNIITTKSKSQISVKKPGEEVWTFSRQIYSVTTTQLHNFPRALAPLVASELRWRQRLLEAPLSV